MANLHGKHVLITGGANGLGRCLADKFAQAGCVLVLTDIDAEGLERAANDLAGIAPAVHTYVVDVGDREAVEAVAAQVIDKLGRLDILINNAGIGHLGELVETPIHTWQKLMDINFWGPLYHIYAFLPAMVHAGEGQIVNISSGQAFFRLPTWGAYATVKTAIGAFSEMLCIELRKFGIKVTTVYPFMINTRFYGKLEGETRGTQLSLKYVPYYSMSPERTARIVFRAVRKGKAVEMVSVLNRLSFYARVLPLVTTLVNRLALRFLGKPRDTLREESIDRKGS